MMTMMNEMFTDDGPYSLSYTAIPYEGIAGEF